MADLLTHVLVPYVLLTVAGWRVSQITPRWIIVGMSGAAIPDLVKIDLLIDASAVGSLLGVPFSYRPVSTLGGVLVIAGAIALTFRREYRRKAYLYVAGGGISSLVLDGLRVYADGSSGFWLYPFSWWRPPTPSLFVSSDYRVTVVAVVVSVVVFTADNLIERRSETQTDES